MIKHLKLPVSGMIDALDDCNNEAINRFGNTLPESKRFRMRDMIEDFRTMSNENRKNHAPRLSGLAGDILIVPAGTVFFFL